MITNRFGCVVFLGLATQSLTSAAGEAVPAYTGEVSGLLSRHCVSCHRTGQLGPIRLDTYEQARLFAREIRKVAGTRKMPPWPAVPGFGEFQNDRSLRIDEIETLIRWTDTGALRGAEDAAVFHAEKNADRRGPAVTLDTKVSYRVPASGDVECRCFAIPPHAIATKENAGGSIVVKGIDVVPGDARVVHHVRVFADHDGSAQQLDAADPEPGFNCFQNSDEYQRRTSLGEWTAGLPPQRLPADTGRVLPPRTGAVVEIRYHRIGQPVLDRTRVRLLIEDRPVLRLVRTRVITNGKIDIPADSWSHRAEAGWVADENITLLSVAPEMDGFGTEIQVTAILPDGTTKPLVWVREFDRNRQMAYVLKNPLKVAAGTRIRVTGEFDNFETNPNVSKSQPARAQMAVWLEYTNEN